MLHGPGRKYNLRRRPLTQPSLVLVAASVWPPAFSVGFGVDGYGATMRSVGKKGCCANRRTRCGCSPSVLTLVCIPAKRGSGTGSTTRATLSDGTIMHDVRIPALCSGALRGVLVGGSPVWSRCRSWKRNHAQREPSARLGFSKLHRECAQSHCIATGDFSPKSGEGGGLKNRCRQSKKNAIGQVFTCRILYRLR